MNQARRLDVRASSIRVALTATALVGLAYIVIAGAVLAIVTTNLTAQVDARLAESIREVGHSQERPPGGFRPPSDGRPFDPVTPIWTVSAGGEVTSSLPNAELPEEFREVVGPTTIRIGDEDVRVRGAEFRDSWVVVGQSLGSVNQARGTIILAELVIGPILLVLVFLGAVAIGRRVAAPIDLARQRQMEFTADASHELRTPLSVIEAQTSLALAHDRDATWYRTAFGRVDEESRRMRRLIDDLLWLARFDATAGPPGAEPVDVGVLAGQAIDRFGVVAERRGLQLSLAVAAGEGGAVVTAPPDWLDRLLGVLLDNACRYSPDGGSVAVSIRADGERTHLTVDDTGPGIPVEDRERIFDRFRRATDAPGGAGLGLAIGDAIVRASGGRWRLGSSPSGGASMSVSWPATFGTGNEPDIANAALRRGQEAG